MTIRTKSQDADRTTKRELSVLICTRGLAKVQPELQDMCTPRLIINDLKMFRELEYANDELTN